MTEYEKLFEERGEAITVIIEIMYQTTKRPSKQMEEDHNKLMEMITHFSDQLKQSQKEERPDQADNCEKVRETSDKLLNKNETKEIKVTNVSKLQKNLSEVCKETQLDINSKQMNELFDEQKTEHDKMLKETEN